MRETLTGQEFVAELLQQMDGRFFAVTSTVPERKATCVVASDSDDIAVLNPTPAVPEARLVRSSIYVLDQPDAPKPWFSFDPFFGDDRPVPSQEIADGANSMMSVARDDCSWRDRLSAIDPTGTVKVTKAGKTGVVVSASTDNDSQYGKDSASKHTYGPATWTVSPDGYPLSYKAGDGSRSLTFELWEGPRVEAPGDELVRR